MSPKQCLKSTYKIKKVFRQIKRHLDDYFQKSTLDVAMVQMWPWIKVRSTSAYCRNSKNVHTAGPRDTRFLVPEKTVQLKNALLEVYTYVLRWIVFKETCNFKAFARNLYITSVFGTNCTY